MSSAMNIPKVSGLVFQGISILLKETNIDPIRFYEKFSLTPKIEDTLDQLVPFATFIDILRELKNQTNISHPSLRLSTIQNEMGNSPYIKLIASAPTLEVAMQIGERFRYAYSEVTYWNAYFVSDVVVVQRQSFVPLEASDREHCLYAISFLYRLIKKVYGKKLQVSRISLIQPKDNDSNAIEGFFDCPVSFAQDFDGFTLDVNEYYKPNENFDAKTYQYLLSKLTEHLVYFPKTQLFSTVVKSLVSQTLSTGNSSLVNIARAAGISGSTVKKRLKKEGLTFTDVVIDVRMNVAKRLLVQPDISLTQISAMLGYSEASAFSRAFYALTKLSPRDWRKQSKNHMSK